MIGRISGKLLEKLPPHVLVEAAGVGYEIDVPMSTFYNLPELGGQVSLHVQMVVREDAHLLFGFLTPGEREMFRMLLKVNGIGARTALSILSGLSVTELAAAVATQDAGRLIRVPGIGKKTAERLLLELKDKLGALPSVAPGAAAASHAQSDILHALLALGYNDKEATAALKLLPAEVGVSDGIKLALKSLAKT